MVSFLGSKGVKKGQLPNVTQNVLTLYIVTTPKWF
jgi:hypothetical protein